MGRLTQSCRIPAIMHAVCTFFPSSNVGVAVSGTAATVVGEASLLLSSFGEEWQLPPSEGGGKKAAPPPADAKKEKKKAIAKALGEAAAEAAPAQEEGDVARHTLKASINYIPMNEGCTEESCAGRVVVLDAIGDYLARMRDAVACGCRAVLLTLHTPSQYKLLKLRIISHAKAVKGELTVESEPVALDVDGPPKPVAVPTLPPDFTRFPVPVVCIAETKAVKIRNALNVPRDLDPAVLVPRLHMEALKAQGFAEELCARALEREENDYDAALAWLVANAKLFAQQTSMMAELDAAVVESAKEKRRAAAAAALAPPPPKETPVPVAVAAPPPDDTAPDAAPVLPPITGPPRAEGKDEPPSDDAPPPPPVPAQPIPSAMDLIRQDDCWPLASRWQSTFPNSVLVISDRYDVAAAEQDEEDGGRAETSSQAVWMASAEAVALDLSSPASLLKTWVSLQHTLHAHYARRTLVR